MNEDGKRHGMVRNIAKLAGLAVLTGVVAVLEARQVAHHNDPAVIELRFQEEKRRRKAIADQEKRNRRYRWEMAILHYLTLALLLVALALFLILILGYALERNDAVRHGRPAPPVPDLTFPFPFIPI